MKSKHLLLTLLLALLVPWAANAQTVVGNSWSDNFEGETCGWTLTNGTATNIWAWGTAVNNGGTHALYVSNDNGTTNAYTNNEMGVVYASKLFTFTAGKFQISFDWKANGESNYDYMRVWLVPATVTLPNAGYLPNGVQLTSYSQLSNYTSTTPANWIDLGVGKLNQKTAWQTGGTTISQLAAGNYYILFMWGNDTSGGTNPPAAVDNVSITRIACPYDVTGLAVATDPAVTQTTATVTWTAGEATQWQVAYSANSSFEGATQEIVSTASYNMTGLTANTKYYVKVRAYCGGEDYGTWCNAISFYTECPEYTTIPAEGWTINFDDMTGTTSGSTNNLPHCWNYINTSTNSSYKGYPVVYNGSSDAKSTPNYLRFYSYYYYPGDEYAILPAVQNVNTLRVKFYAKTINSASNAGTLHVGVMTDETDASTFVAVGDPIIPNTTTYQLYTVSLSSYNGTGTRIAIKMDAATGSSLYVYVDDILVEEIPDCLEPDNLAEVANTATAHSVTFGWTAVNNETTWKVQYKKSDATDWTTVSEPVTQNPYTLPGLDRSSTYQVRVAAWCNPSNPEGISSYTEPITVQTECEAITDFPVSYGFETSEGFPSNASTPTTNQLGACWRNEATVQTGSYGARLWGTSTSYKKYGSQSLILPDKQSGNKTMLVFPEMNFTSPNGYVVSFWIYRGTTGSNPEGFKVYISDTDTISTNAVFLGHYSRYYDIAYPKIESTSGWYNYEIEIPQTTMTGNVHLIFEGQSYYGNATYVDNLIVRQAPDCATPTGLAVTANSQTPEGATITWTAGDATSWIVEYKKSTEENYTAIAEPVNAATYTFTGLDASTTYNVRVKVNCTAGAGVTYPTDPVNFTTEAACPAPKNLVVSGITATQATLTWTPGYDETAWTVKYKKHSDTDYITAPTVSGTPTCTVYDLTGGTVYDVQIIGCDDTHIYTVSSAFTTAFGVPFLEEFATSSIPSGWNQYSELLTPEVLNGTTPLSTGGSWTFNNNTVLGQYHTRLNIFGTTCKSWLLTPNIVLTANQSLNFDLALTDYSSTSAIEFPEGQADDKFVVLITTNNGATWSILRQWDNAGSEYVYNNIYYKGEEVYIDLAAYSGQTVRIAFYGESTIAVTGEDNDLHIDNVSIDNTPTCFRPTAVTDSNVTNHSATISWTPGETGQSAWQIAYKKGETFDPTDPALDWTTITMVNVTENPTYTFDKVFDAASNYYFYVRANCGTTAEPDYSAWSKKVCVIATEAAAPAPTTFAKTNVGPDYVDLYWNKPVGDYLSGYGIYYSTSSTTPTDETEAIESITVIEAPTAEAPYTLSGLTANTQYYFWIRANHEANVYSSWKAINGSYFTTPEACAKPTSLAASEPSPSSIKLSWTAGATWQTSWVIAYSKTEGFDPTDSDACTYVDADENPFVVEGLDPEETYYFRVKGDCDTYGESVWNLTESSETTLMACPAPTDIVASNLTQNTADLTWTGYSDNYNIRYRALTPAAETQTTTEDFSGYTATSYSQEGSLPEGWKGYSSYTYTGYKPHVSSNSALGSSYDLEGFAGGATSTDNFLYMIGNSTYPYSSYTILPQISDLEAFSFDYGFENASNGTLTVGYCTDNTSGSTFTAFNDLTITGSTTSVTVSLTAADIATLNANNGYLTFSWVYSSSYGVGIDNVAITTRTYTPGEWIDPVLTSNTEAISLDELTAGTKYEVQVQAVCDPTSSDWSESCKFTTYGADTKVFTNAANDGLWGTAGNWVPTGAPVLTDNAILRANATIESGCVAEAKKITLEGTLTPTLTIADGGQLKTDNAVTATVKKNITGYGAGNEENRAGYYLIANPLSSYVYSSSFATVGLTTGNYDLYSWSYSSSDGLEWRNYETSSFSLYNGTGYLYANENNAELTFTGTVKANNVDEEKTPSYYSTNPDEYEFNGWQLFGNPFVCNAYLNDANENLAFYRMNPETGAGFIVATGAIAPMEGIFVQATDANQTFKFSRNQIANSRGQLNINLSKAATRGASLADNAIIRFGEGNLLEKFCFSNNSSKVYIPMEGKDYAVVNAEGNVGEIPVSFEAKNNGTYTLSFTNEEVSFAYLHLIDNMTGIETDLLANPSYTFEARTTDYASRFKLVFATGSSTGSDTFAYYSNGNWVINNEGRATLQVVDVNGRILKSESINGCANVNFKAAAGIYMIRLVNGDNVKVQKVVVR